MSVIAAFFDVLQAIDNVFWTYIGFLIVVSAGIYCSIRSRFFQFKVLAQPRQTYKVLRGGSREGSGTHPWRLFFTSVGGMVGLGNIVGVVTALQLGGPGALFWLWIAALSGTLIKYSEVYLGITYRTPNARGGYDGGPMYYLQKAFGNKVLAKIFCVFLCIYGVEIYQFVVIADSVSQSWAIDRWIVVTFLLACTIYVGFGGVNRVAWVCSILMPMFILMYFALALWIISHHLADIPDLLAMVVRSAFSGHAPLGGFAGSTMLLAIQYGTARSVYSGDIGLGYDATIQSETQSHAAHQARLVIFAVLTDALICTLSIIMVLVTKVWLLSPAIPAAQWVAQALGYYFPNVDFFMALFIFLSGFTTVVAYLAAGTKAARFLSPRWGFLAYMVYATVVFVFFSFFDQSKAILVMTVSGGCLLTINMAGVWKLRRDIRFE